MEYVTNEVGDIKMIDSQGNFKWLHKSVVENHKLMTRMGLEPAPKPQEFEQEVKTPPVVDQKPVVENNDQKAKEDAEAKKKADEKTKAKAKPAAKGGKNKTNK